MKLSIKFLAIAALLFTFNFSATAQRGAKEKPSPTLVAQKQTDRMVEDIGLSERQTKQVNEINLVYAQKMKKAHEASKGDRDAMKASKKVINTERKTAMKNVLTEKQFVAFDEMRPRKKGKGKKKEKCEGKCKTAKS